MPYLARTKQCHQSRASGAGPMELVSMACPSVVRGRIIIIISPAPRSLPAEADSKTSIISSNNSTYICCYLSPSINAIGPAALGGGLKNINNLLLQPTIINNSSTNRVYNS
jgi:hypothetical protein